MVEQQSASRVTWTPRRRRSAGGGGRRWRAASGALGVNSRLEVEASVSGSVRHGGAGKRRRSDGDGDGDGQGVRSGEWGRKEGKGGRAVYIARALVPIGGSNRD